MKIKKRVDSELNAIPNKYKTAEEVGSQDGECLLFVQSGDREENGCRDDRYGTTYVESAFDKKRGDGRAEHSNKQYDQHQKKQSKRGGGKREHKPKVRISEERQQGTGFIYTGTIKCSEFDCKGDRIYRIVFF